MTSASRPPLFCISARLRLSHGPGSDLLPAVQIRPRSGPLGLAWTFQHVKGPAFLRKTSGFLHKRFIYYFSLSIFILRAAWMFGPSVKSVCVCVRCC